MTADQLRAHITAVPFTPFHIRTADGRRLPVLNRDFILINPPQTHTFVFHPSGNGAYEVLDISMLLGVEYGPPAAEPKLTPADTSA